MTVNVGLLTLEYFHWYAMREIDLQCLAFLTEKPIEVREAQARVTQRAIDTYATLLCDWVAILEAKGQRWDPNGEPN